MPRWARYLSVYSYRTGQTASLVPLLTKLYDSRNTGSLDCLLVSVTVDHGIREDQVLAELERTI